MNMFLRLKLKSQSGYTMIPFLILMPVFIMLLVASIEITDTITVADVNVQDSLADACKNAAGQIITASQANGQPRIDAASALDEFENSLEENLDLGNSSNGSLMAALTNSHYTGTPQIYFLVYNGDADYGGDECDYWSVDGASITTEPIGMQEGFPATFYVSDSGINTLSGTYEVTLNSPGVVAVITIQKVQILGNVPVVVNRWASATIVWQSS